MWINSLGLEDLYVNSLFEECKEGMLLLQVMDHVSPGCVDWTKVEKKAGKNQIKRTMNCSTAVNSAKNMGCKTPGVSGSNIVKGDRKSILAIVWQVVRFEYLKYIGQQSEKDLFNWANNLVEDESQRVTGFKDKSLSTSVWYFHVFQAIAPGCVNWEIVTQGETDEDKEMNAKYAISIARMLGAVVFCVWEDLVDCNQKMMLVLVSALKRVSDEGIAVKKEE